MLGFGCDDLSFSPVVAVILVNCAILVGNVSIFWVAAKFLRQMQDNNKVRRKLKIAYSITLSTLFATNASATSQMIRFLFVQAVDIRLLITK